MGERGVDAKTYDGHTGLDVSIGSFRNMDRGVGVYAVAPGTVMRTTDGNFDRNVAFLPGCGDSVNAVYVTHPSGYYFEYLHFKKDTIAVEPGQTIQAGTYLGEVGSSGCSNGPHVHVELRDCGGAPIDPFLTGLVLDPPTYDAPMRLFEVTFRATPFPSADLATVFTQAAPNVTSVPVATTMGSGLTLADGIVGDTVAIEVRRGDGSRFDDLRGKLTIPYPSSVWFWNRTLTGAPGEWTATIRLDGEVARVVSFEVTGDAKARAKASTLEPWVPGPGEGVAHPFPPLDRREPASPPRSAPAQR